MIARVYKVLATVADPVAVSVGTDASSYADVLPENVAHVRDRFTQAGPLAGLEAGFRAFQSDWVLVVACDMPHVTADGMHALLRARAASVEAIVGRSSDGRLHPLFACYRRERVRAVAQACLSEQAYALHALLDRLAVQEVAVSARTVHNVNRPQDLKAGPHGGSA